MHMNECMYIEKSLHKLKLSEYLIFGEYMKYWNSKQNRTVKYCKGNIRNRTKYLTQSVKYIQFKSIAQIKMENEMAVLTQSQLEAEKSPINLKGCSQYFRKYTKCEFYWFII